MKRLSKILVINIFCIVGLAGMASCKKEPERGGAGTVIIDGGGRPTPDMGGSPNRCPGDYTGGGNNTGLPHVDPSYRDRIEMPFKETWKQFISDELERPIYKSLMSSDIPKSDTKKIGCPNFNKLPKDDRKTALMIIFAGLAKFESKNTPKKYYKEPCRKSKCRDSYGVLQVDPYMCRIWAKKWVGNDISPRGNSYGASGGGNIRNPDPNRIGGSVYDPFVNLECGLTIMEGMWRKRGAKFFTPKGETQYWSPLINGRKPDLHVFLIKHMKQIPACHSNSPSLLKYVNLSSNKYGENLESLSKKEGGCDSMNDTERDEISNKRFNAEEPAFQQGRNSINK